MPPFTKEELESLYLEGFKTETEIGEIFGVSQVTVGRWRRKWGIRTLTKSDRLDLPVLDQTQRDLLVGSLLGDGWMSPVGREAARFQVRHSMNQKDYLLWKAGHLESWISAVREGTDEREGSCYEYIGLTTFSHRDLREFYDFFYPKPKRKRVYPENLKDLLTPFSLAIWYMDSGNLNGLYPWISFGLGEESLRSVFGALRSLGLNPSYHERQGGGEIRFSGQTDIFFDLIRDYVPECMAYKISGLTDRQKMFCNANSLTPKEAVRLHEEEGLSKKEIADAFGISENTVRRRIKKQREPLQYTSQTATKALSEFYPHDSSSKNEIWFRTLSDQDQKSLIDRIYQVLSHTLLPLPELPENADEEWKKFQELECSVDESGYLRIPSNRGLELCSPFFSNRYEVRSLTKSALEAWYNESFLRQAIEFQLSHGDPITPEQVLQAVELSCRTPSIFCPGVAKALVDIYGIEGGVVYGPCMGYGGQLLGAMASQKNVKYFGLDGDRDTIRGNFDLAQRFGFVDRVFLVDGFSEKRYSVIEEFDLAVLGRFHFDTKNYLGSLQLRKSPSLPLSSWILSFFDPLLDSIRTGLKKGGLFAINISDSWREGKGYSLEEMTKTLCGKKGLVLMDVLKMPVSLEGQKSNRDYEPIFIFQK